MNPDEKAWLRTFAPSPGAPRVYALSHAGGSASSHLALARVLSPRVELVGVQYPGRLDRFAEEPVESVTELADAIATVIRTRGDQSPALFGHSMGALVAFEIARRVPSVRHLFLSGALPPPHFGLSGRLSGNGDAGPSDEDLLAEIRGFGGTQAELLDEPSMLELILPPLRSDYRALARYRPEPARVAAPVTVLIGESDPRTTPELADRWADRTTAAPTPRHVFAGGHFYLHEYPKEIAEIIATTLHR